MNPEEQKTYNVIFRKVLHQVLLDPTKSKLLKKISIKIDRKPSAILRDLANEFIKNNSDPEEFKYACEEDERLQELAQESRIKNGFNWTK